ncbi:MAG: aminopeptidase N [Microbacteriaceae bacterium]|nr:aminopeptidase N [Microbacteriaceae bacterium]
MADLNLTQDEAQARAELLTVEDYDVHLDLTTGPTLFGSVTTIHFDARSGSSTFLDAVTDEISSLILNGVQLDPREVSDGRRIQLQNLQEHNTVTVSARARYSTTGEGLHRFVDPVDGATYLYSQFEVPDAQRMYACFDQPDLKATFTFHVTAPDTWVVLSNAPTPSPTPVAVHTARWDFPPTQRLSTYVTALIAGPYAEHRSELTSVDGRTIPLGAYCRASLDRFFDPEEIFDITRKGFAFYERAWDVPYPFEKYDQIFVPDFNAGAMENAGAITFTETYVFRSKVTDAVRERRVVTILHELAHMWFGDLVTMRWWNDLWLNESFAEFMSTLATAEATEWADAWATFASSEKTWAYAQDQLPSTHPIVADIPDLKATEVNFDGITYAKGASVLKSLVAYVGRDAFFAGAHRYFTTHAHGNTALNDLLDELEHASGRDLREWSRLWLESAGVNTLTLEAPTSDDDTLAMVRIQQTAPGLHPTLRPHHVTLGLYELEHGALRLSRRLEFDIPDSDLQLIELQGTQRPAALLLNDTDTAYAKIRFDPETLRTLRRSLGTLEDPLARAVVWGSLWDMTRDAELPVADYIDTVLTHLSAENQSTTLRTVLGTLQRALNSFSAPEQRAARRERAADSLWEAATRAPAGSDQQFQFVRAFAASAQTPAQAQQLVALRSGADSLPGLEIDTDLDWELLAALSALGVATEQDLSAALEADHTASGELAAARARAALPDRDAKYALAGRLLTDPSLTNSQVRAMGAGLQQVVDTDLLEPLTALFFAHIEELWNTRSYHIIEEIIGAAYPRVLANETLTMATERWLGTHPEAHPALRRLLLEEADALQRALRVQRADRR